MQNKKTAKPKNKRQKPNFLKERKILVSYWILVFIRFLLCILPQTGYFHPDEFFQSIEVVSDHYFDIDTQKPWEFNATFPVRTCAFPLLTVGISYSILNFLNPFTIHYLKTTLVTPYFLVIFPRILMCIISFISDFCLYKICKTFNYPHEKRLVIFASSYVMLTLATRTFSNCIELVLSSLILYYVSRCMSFSKKIVFQGDFLKKKYDNAETIVDRVKYYKLMLTLPSHSLNDCLILATITASGIFVRPTFLAFAFPPIFFWLHRGLGSRVVNFFDFHLRVFLFAICTLPTCAFFIIIDSLYYKYLTLEEIGRLNIGMENFVVTPLNFLKYNMNPDNLKNHGLHPRYLHFLVNVPLLFNALGILGICMVAKMIYSASRKQWLKLPQTQSIESLMISSFVIPISMLSIFPHQEPRFIIPVILPLCFLCAPILSHSSDETLVVSTSVVNGTSRKSSSKNDRKTSNLERVWYVSNVLLAMFFGFVHQGGVLALASHLAKELRSKPELTHVHLFTSHLYSLPTALLQLRNTKKVYYSSAKHKYKLVQDFYLHEFGSRNLEEAYREISTLVHRCETNLGTKPIPIRAYYAFPASFYEEFRDFVDGQRDDSFNYEIVASFYPHISTEKLPSVNVWECLSLWTLGECWEKLYFGNENSLSLRFLKQFGLFLVKIEIPSNRKQERRTDFVDKRSQKLTKYLLF